MAVKAAAVVVLLCVLLFGVAPASGRGAPQNGRVEKERGVPVSSLVDWKRAEMTEAEKQQTIHLTLALKQNNLPLLFKHLHAVSDPASPSYGQYWDQATVARVVASRSESVQAVSAWLEEHNVTSYKLLPSKDFMQAKVTVHAAEKMLHTSFYSFTHLPSGKKAVKAHSYTVPEAVAPHIDFVAGVLRFPKFPAQRGVAMNAATVPLDQQTTPDLISKTYNITKTKAHPKNIQAVASFLDQYFSSSDLKQMRDTFQLAQQTVEKTIGPNDESKVGIEAELDVQYLMGVADGVRTWVWNKAGLHEGQEPFLEWLADISSTQTIPTIFSISYQDLEPTVSAEYMQRVSTEFAKLGTRGVTLVTGSGDWGTECTDDCKKFKPDFPSSSPYIVSTGATYFCAGAECGINWSSGGFSDVFPQPSYQTTVVSKFLSQSNTPTTYFNASGRAFPDVSTIGVNFQVVVSGAFQPVGGTSASTPTFAAMLSLINNARLAKNLPTLGWVNPFLYTAYAKSPKAFNDVTIGNNKWGCCLHGFSCTSGWDPITGLGTPNHTELLNLALSSELFPSFKNTA